MSKQEKTIEIALKEMFFRVGEEYPNEELTSNPQWYSARTWDIDEEKKFKKWLIDFFAKNLKIPKKMAKLQAEMFILQWGWKTTNKVKIMAVKNG